VSVIFARPDHTYESYSDFFRLVELAGYPTVTIGDIDAQSDNCYIFTTPSTFWHDGTERRGWPDAKARIIYFNLEWYLDVDYTSIPGVETWSADAWYAERTHTRYVPLGSHKDLKLRHDSPNGRVYDVATLFAPSQHRYEAAGQLHERGISIAPNAWGDERHTILMQSRAMLHVHQWDDRPTAAPQRFALAAAYSLPLITETLANPGIFGSGKRLMADLADIGRFTADWMQPERADELAGYGAALHELLCVEWNFKSVIEGAL
jgi:hypothetical protein